MGTPPWLALPIGVATCIALHIQHMIRALVCCIASHKEIAQVAGSKHCSARFQIGMFTCSISATCIALDVLQSSCHTQELGTTTTCTVREYSSVFVLPPGVTCLTWHFAWHTLRQVLKLHLCLSDQVDCSLGLPVKTTYAVRTHASASFALH